MDALSPLQIGYFVVILIVSFSLRGSAGFGGLNGPLLMVVLPAKVVVPALVFLGILSSAAIVVRDYRHILWSAVRQTLPYGIAGTAAGLFLFDALETQELEKGLGLFILFYGLYSLWCLVHRPKPLNVAPGIIAGVMGTTSGVIGTMFGALAGIFVAVFLDILRLDKRTFRVTMAATLMLMGIARAGGYVSVGAVTEDVVIIIVAALPLMGIGVVLGNRLHTGLNQMGFSRLIGLLFVVIGGFLFIR